MPYKTGRVTIIVNDTGLLGEVLTTQVSAEVLFSDIFVLTLQGGGHVELGKQTPAKVLPLDIDGKPFDVYHYQFMDIELMVDDSSNVNGDPLEFTLIDR